HAAASGGEGRALVLALVRRAQRRLQDPPRPAAVSRAHPRTRPRDRPSEREDRSRVPDRDALLPAAIAELGRRRPLPRLLAGTRSPEPRPRPRTVRAPGGA